MSTLQRSITELGIVERRKILRANRGLLAAVARELSLDKKITRQAVSRAYWRKKGEAPVSARAEALLLRKIAEIRDGDKAAAENMD